MKSARRHSNCTQHVHSCSKERCHGPTVHPILLYMALKLCTPIPVCSAMQKSFGQCSAGFMTKTSPTNPNGFCARTCGRCNCPAAPTSQAPSSPGSSPSSVPSSPRAVGNSPRATRNSPRPIPSSPVAAPSSPSAAGRSPAAAGTAQAPPQPLSAAFAANCDCSDVPPDGTTCASVVRFLPSIVPMPILDCYSPHIATQTVCTMHNVFMSASMLKGTDRSQQIQTRVLLVIPDDSSVANGLLHWPAIW